MTHPTFREAIAVLPPGWAPAPRDALAQKHLALALSGRDVCSADTLPTDTALESALIYAGAYQPPETFAGHGWMRPYGWEFQDGSRVLSMRHGDQVLCFPWAVVPQTPAGVGETIHPPFGPAPSCLAPAVQAALDAALHAMADPGTLYPWSAFYGPRVVYYQQGIASTQHPAVRSLDPVLGIARVAGEAIAAAAAMVYQHLVQHPVDAVESAVDAAYVGLDGRWRPPAYDPSVLVSHVPDTPALQQAEGILERWIPEVTAAVDRALLEHAGVPTLRQHTQQGTDSQGVPIARWHFQTDRLPLVLCAQTYPPPVTSHGRLAAMAAAQAAFPGWPALPM